MTLPVATHCNSCGTPVGSASGRCPRCGASLGALPELQSVSQLAPSLRVRRAATQAQAKKRVVAIVAMVLVAATIVTVLLVVRPGGSPAPASASVAPSPPPPAPTKDVEVKHQASPTDSFPSAKTRALKWHKEAALLEVHAQPVKGGFVDLTGDGFMEFVFGQPRGGQLPGEATENKQYVVRMDASGTHGNERSGGGVRVAGEPGCAFFDAWTKAVASGVGKTDVLRVDYGYAAPLKRSVWTFGALAPEGATPGPKTRLDGFDCAIIVR
ncbi:MAG: hypothetical protein H6718_36545 [Polyangiaceae bacterium]|nr:hypothetical protein [Myxococcales bacterium]MCB9590972.1 hypothetical protein [Polyangiaceae bacterium]MCB9605168.1 hypothetical protein [Polyangiaceae bacterium]